MRIDPSTVKSVDLAFRDALTVVRVHLKDGSRIDYETFTNEQVAANRVEQLRREWRCS